MSEYVKRERSLQRLIDRRNNGDVKIITGPRRSGKSFLLKTIYRDPGSPAKFRGLAPSDYRHFREKK